jgi:opacity protein-like surface antigen
MKGQLMGALFLLAALMPTMASAQALEPEAAEALESQESQESQEEGAAEAKPVEDDREFRPGTLDLMLGVGLDFGGLFYPHIEPGIDVGLIPIGEDVTLSVSLSVDMGYCLLCGVLSFVDGVEISSYYIAPTARGIAHLNFLSRLLQMPELDISAGVLVSPALYVFDVSYQGTTYKENSTIVSLGPVFGLRYILDSGLMLFLEYRYLVSFGFSNQTITGQNGQNYVLNTGDLVRYGQSYTVGIGYRF